MYLEIVEKLKDNWYCINIRIKIQFAFKLTYFWNLSDWDQTFTNDRVSTANISDDQAMMKIMKLQVKNKIHQELFLNAIFIRIELNKNLMKDEI